MQESRDAGKKGCRKGGIQKMRDAKFKFGSKMAQISAVTVKWRKCPALFLLDCHNSCRVCSALHHKT